jgi:chemotaxis protein CheX
MEADYLEPFAMAAENVFQTALGCELTREAVQLKQHSLPVHEVSGVIRLTGKASGAAALSVSSPVAFQIVAAMLDLHVSEINSDVTDAIGELTNMIAGGAKTFLSDYQLSLGLPEIVLHQSRPIDFSPSLHPAAIRFASPWGPLAVEVGLL